MKTIILTLSIAIAVMSNSKGQNSTIYRNVYDFNVGDVFEYKREGYSSSPNLTDLQHFEITGKTHTNATTVQYTRNYYFVQDYLSPTGSFPPYEVKRSYTSGSDVVTYSFLNDTVALPSRNTYCDSVTAYEHIESVYYDSAWCAGSYKHRLQDLPANSQTCLIPIDAGQVTNIFVNELGCVLFDESGSQSGYNYHRFIHLYHYIIKDSLGNQLTCGAQDSAFNYFAIGLNNKNAQQTILKLYPNPTTHTLNIYTPQAAYLIIYNLLGSIIQTIYTTKETTTINTSNLPNGVYFIKTNTGQVGKFVKE
ncbi:MAG: T9SS type A sorting domain-containing protein [Bacteroidia bacterium]|nr:T9SS type A sorting domain-containing protein [Bacteroidia bacterium]